MRAKRLRLTPLHVGASIRINDSLHEGSSRFYSEITRLRQIVDLTDYARGDPDFPEIESWAELRAYLHSSGASHEIVLGARSAWRSFVARRSLERRSL